MPLLKLKPTPTLGPVASPTSVLSRKWLRDSYGSQSPVNGSRALSAGRCADAPSVKHTFVNVVAPPPQPPGEPPIVQALEPVGCGVRLRRMPDTDDRMRTAAPKVPLCVALIHILSETGVHVAG